MNDRALLDLSVFFDLDWYLSQYPDVAAAGVDPLQHYLQHGRFENRWPCDLPALKLDTALWAAPQPEPILAELETLLAQHQPLHSNLAAWVLARWHGCFGRWQLAYRLIEPILANDAALAILAHAGPFLLAFNAAVETGDIALAKQLLARPDWAENPDKQLAQSMLLQGSEKIAQLNRLFAQQGLTALAADSGCSLATLKAMPAKPCGRWWWQPLVSIIMPCYNAEATLGYALASLQAQSWRKLQIIVVDDASTDSSAALVAEFAARDKRITLLKQTVNQGAYAARNAGLALARGEFITVHDSDDWSHPDKIERQLRVLRQQRRLMGTMSHYVRSSHKLAFGHWRIDGSWTYRNTSSLLFRRKVVKQLGFWDSVSVGADSEYQQRILKHFGDAAIVDVMPGVPLSFGLADPASLTQTQATHLRTQFYGLRFDYRQAVAAWHGSGDKLYVPQRLTKRPFAVPPLMCRGSDEVRQHNLMLVLRQKQCFNPDWYLSQHADVAAAGADPLQHFVCHGASEGRDPMPGFSLSAYALAHQLALPQALTHWLTATHPENGPIWLKQQTCQPGRQHMVVVAHAAGTTLYGAERSLVDVLQQLNQLPLMLTLVLPSAINPTYIDQLLPLCQQLVVLPYAWWRSDRPLCQSTLTCFADLYQTLAPDLVYQNTCVLYEPLYAAKQRQLPTLMHVRELPEQDTDLCRLLHATPAAVATHIQQLADHIIANSAAVADFVACPQRTLTLPNTLSLSLLQCPPRPAGPRLQLGMMSSNLAKKGIADFFALAQQAAQQQLPIDFLLFGPQTPLLQQLMQQYPDIVQYRGYVAEPMQALAQLDAVVNLSHFAESFGRTLLEAMACKRLVLAYRFGAFADWLPPAYTVQAELADWPALLAQLTLLLPDTERLSLMLDDAARYAWQHYAPAQTLPMWRQLLAVSEK